MSQSMADDGRHLRTRWSIAGTGWMLWAILMCMPYPGGISRRLWYIYPEAFLGLAREGFHVRSRQQILLTAAILGFVIASVAFFCSPLLLACSHSSRPRTRRWRWFGLPLLAMAQLSIMLLFSPKGPSTLLAHLLVLSHVIVCAAVLPWPREGAVRLSGFEVHILDEERADS